MPVFLGTHGRLSKCRGYRKLSLLLERLPLRFPLDCLQALWRYGKAARENREHYPQKRVAHTSAGRILDWQEQRGSSCGWREGFAAVQPVYRRFHQWCMDPRRRTLRGSIRNVQASALSAAVPAQRKKTNGNRCGLAILRAPI